LLLVVGELLAPYLLPFMPFSALLGDLVPLEPEPEFDADEFDGGVLPPPLKSLLLCAELGKQFVGKEDDDTPLDKLIGRFLPFDIFIATVARQVSSNALSLCPNPVP